MTPIAVFLCDKTGRAAEPWAEAGIECFCVDVQHSIRRDRCAGLINFVWGDARSWTPPEGRRVVFVGAFPPCTHVAGSGARDWQKKGQYMLTDALQLFTACRLAAVWSGAPFFIENPRGALSKHMGAPDYKFDPCDYAGYLADPDAEAYTKDTHLWTGNGFVMPVKRPVPPLLGSMMHLMPPSDERADDRSVTPSGFARAVFEANCPPHLRMAQAAEPPLPQPQAIERYENDGDRSG
jgi:hypothetical protein